MKDLGLKFLSVLIATLLCVYVNSDNNISSARINVNVEVRDVPSDKVVVWQSRKNVEVEVRGPSFLVARVSASPPTLRVKLPEAVGSKFTAQINRSDLDLDAPLQVVSIEPSSIPFTIENKLIREVPVKLAKTGALHESVRLNSLELDPNVVTVTGPESEVKDLQFVQTAPIDFGEIKESGFEDVVLRVPGKQSELSRQSVRAEYKLELITTKRTFDNIEIEVRVGAGESVKIEPGSVNITVSGTREMIEGLKGNELIPYVRVGPEQKKRGVSEIHVDSPVGVAIDEIVPQSVKLITKGR